MAEYATEHLTAYTGGSTLVDHDFLLRVVANIDSLPRWLLEAKPALMELSDEYRALRRKVIAKASREPTPERHREGPDQREADRPDPNVNTFDPAAEGVGRRRR